MEKRNKRETQKEEEKKKQEIELSELISEKERADLLMEVAKTQEALRELKRQQRVSLNEPISNQPMMPLRTSKSRKHSSSPLSLSISESSCKSDKESQSWSGVKSLYFTMKGEKVKVERLALVGHNVQGGSVYCGYLPELNGKLVAISEWTVVPARPLKSEKAAKKVAFCDNYSRDEKNFLKQLNTIEQELSAMLKVKHPNVVQYLGLSYEHQTLRIFEEFVHGSNFSSYLSENLSIDQALLRHYTASILEALVFMHEHNFVHRDLRDTSIYMESSGLIKVGDFSIDKRVRDLILLCHGDPNAINNDLLATDKFPLAIGRGGKKVDIFRLGILVLSFYSGEIVHDPLTQNLKNLPPDFADFLRKCLVRDERERWSADQLLNHSWIKNPSPLLDHLSKHINHMQIADGQDSQKFHREHTLAAQSDFGGLAGHDDLDQSSSADKPLPSFWINNIGQSRLKSEFSWLSPLGKGGFGEVFKVKNNLDSQVYAIKRIKLDQKNKQLTRKLRKEVELLSRLNHENVVRYYNSWIEACPADEEDEDTDLADEESAISNAVIQHTLNKSMGYKTSCSTAESDIFGVSFLPFSESPRDEGWSSGDDDIIFEHSHGTDDDEADEAESSGESSSEAKSDVDDDDEEEGDQVDSHTKYSIEKKSNLKILQFLYIQMEFCDNQTLRSAIDNGLHQDTKRMWRMFREIIEGLHHIHSQGVMIITLIKKHSMKIFVTLQMIHRDLKPVNIFLDSSDQIKIGDFGLATTNFDFRAQTQGEQDHDAKVTSNDDEAGMTGQIGTAMYVAPEINAGKVIAAYNQKVDIYSLGIIFFEMCTPALTTGMERIKVLSALRSKDILLPEDFDQTAGLQAKIIRWLLGHDPSSRPTSWELLQSDYLPPPQVEEAQLQEMVKHTLASHNSKSYRHLIDACLSQSMDLKRDVIYDIDLELPKDLKQFLLKQEVARAAIVEVFKKHGAILVTSPQLTPKGKSLDVYDKTEHVVKAMTRSGNVVFLPFDLRVPLARYLIRSKTTHLKRYNIAMVFREKKMFGLQPKERFECAFDIVEPTKNLVNDAEVLLVSDQIMHSFASIRESGCFFRINHVNLLKGILNHFGIAPEDHRLVHDTIRHNNTHNESKKVKMATLSQFINEQVVANLFFCLEKEGSPEQLASALRHLTRKNNEAGSDIKKSLKELESIVKFAQAMGLKSKIIVSPSLVSHLDYFSGMIFQVVIKQKRGYDILAVGGRYDKLIATLASTLNVDIGSNYKSPFGVGLSLGLETLAARVRDEDKAGIWKRLDIVIHSSTISTTVIPAKLELAHQLWNKGVRCSLADPGWGIDEVQDFAQESGASLIVIFQESDSAGNVRLLELQQPGSERFTERKVPKHELLGVLLSKALESAENHASCINPGLTRMDSSTKVFDQASSANHFHLPSSAPQVNIDFQYYPDRKNGTVRKHLESRINAKLIPSLNTSSPLASFTSGTYVQVLVLPFSGSVIRSIVAIMDFEDESKFNETLKELITKHSRHKKELSVLCQDISDLKSGGKAIPTAVFVLYSSEDFTYKIILL